MSPLLAPESVPAPPPARPERGPAAARLSPGLEARLRARGADPDAAPGEEPEEHRARLETALMALFRDERADEAFEALYRVALEFVRRSVGSALRGSSGAADPSELVQDAFVNVYRYAGGFRDESPRSFRSWASTICANVVRRHFGRRGRLSLQAFPEAFQEPADLREEPGAAAQSVEERRALGAAWQLLLLHYAAAWRELSPRDRLALHLVEVEGLSYAEACARLRVGMSNMKMIMFRARKRIRARMGLAMEERPGARRLAG